MPRARSTFACNARKIGKGHNAEIIGYQEQNRTGRFFKEVEAMKLLTRGIGLAAGVWALGLMGSAILAGGAWAQENLDQGKSGAQLFASDCAICHKTSAGLSKGHVLGLEGFLQQHYTASRESAAAIAAYVNATDKGPAAPAPTRAAKKGSGKDDKTGDKAKGDDKTGDKTKSGEKKLVLPGDTNSGDAKPSDSKPADTKPAEAKPAAAKPAADKPAADKPSDGQPADIYKPEKKSD
jgi:hypothetical protein